MTLKQPCDRKETKSLVIKLAFLYFVFDEVTKLTGNELYFYKTEAQQFFTLTWSTSNPCHDTYIMFYR